MAGNRSIKKGPFVCRKLLKKVNQVNNNTGKKIVIKTWSRSSTIIPEMINLTIAVHNGKEHVPVLILDQMIGMKLGAFVPTRKFKGHSGGKGDKSATKK